MEEPEEEGREGNGGKQSSCNLPAFIFILLVCFFPFLQKPQTPLQIDETGKQTTVVSAGTESGMGQLGKREGTASSTLFQQGFLSH